MFFVTQNKFISSSRVFKKTEKNKIEYDTYYNITNLKVSN